MKIIYKPKGKAREYSPLAANLYIGCNHGCKYCYAPKLAFKSRKDFLDSIPRKNLLKNWKSNCEKHYNSEKQIFFCFMSDPYNSTERDLQLTRKCLEIALINKLKIAILTKAVLVLRDIDLFKKFEENIKVGFTLTFDNVIDSLRWEPDASFPGERIEVLRILKRNNIKTWASFEPVIYPDQSINLIQKTLPYVDEYKIGKINNYKGLDKHINWDLFLKKVVEILRNANKKFYIKKDLREIAPDIKLYDNEIRMD